MVLIYIQGLISLGFNDKSSAKGLAKHGRFIDIVRYFDSDGKLLNVTNLCTGKLFFLIMDTCKILPS